MTIVFWNFKSVLLVDFLEVGDPVTTERRRGSLESFRQAIRRKRPGLLLPQAPYYQLYLLTVTAVQLRTEGQNFLPLRSRTHRFLYVWIPEEVLGWQAICSRL